MGIKSNFLYNLILTLSNYVVGLIIFPYISRVLGVSNIGIAGFVDNSLNYFILFATMGINIVGAREIAKYQNEPEKLSQVFSSILSISVIFLSIVFSIFLVLVYVVPQFSIYKELFLVGTLKLVFTIFAIEWFYRGTENFRYISIRKIAINVIYMLSLFVFVRTSDDLFIYFFLTVGTIVINAIVNLLYSRKFVQYTFANVSIKPYLKQTLSLGIYSMLTSMYTTFNVMYLGFVSTPVEVGYYVTAIKIYFIILGIFTAFTGVMLPRMSALISEGNIEKFNQLISKSFELLISISIPIVITTVILAAPIIQVLSGQGYEGAIIPMQIIMPLIIIVGFAQILAVQVLMPMKRDKPVLISSIIGASLGIILNISLVPVLNSIGTSLVILLSELTVTSYYFIYVYRNKIIALNSVSWLKFIYIAIPYIIINLSIHFFISKLMLIVFFALFLNFTYFIISQLFIIKNDVFVDQYNQIKVRFIKQT